MSVQASIAGIGVVTPWGRCPEKVCDALLDGKPPPAETCEVGGHRCPGIRIEEKIVFSETRLPRLRRSSAISHFAVAAATDALESAGVPADERAAIPILFATSDGGVRYTRRFFSGIVENGPGSGSPLLFPETVYNAPASHIASVLGSDREATAIVGDSCAALSALVIAAGWLADGEAQRVLVVAAQEYDPLAALGYEKWNFLGPSSHDGRIVASEGAAAVLLDLSPSPLALEFCAEGIPFRVQAEAGAHLEALIEKCRKPTAGLIFPSAGLSDLQKSEERVCHSFFPQAHKFDLLPLLGEAFAATTLLRVALSGPMLKRVSPKGSALIPCLGTMGGVAAALLTDCPLST